MATITDIVTTFQKNSSWIKTVVILLLLGFLILAVTNVGCNRKQRDKFIAQTTILNLKNDSLIAQNKAMQNYVAISEIEKDKHYRHILLLTKINDSLIFLSNKQKIKISEISANVAKMSTDSVYKHLTQVAYPDTGKMIYPFSDDQIRRIDENYFRTAALDRLTEIFNQQINNSDQKLIVMDSIVSSYKVIEANLTYQNNNLSQVINNKDKEIDLYKKQERQANTNSIIWKISTGLATVIAIIAVFK